MSLYYTQRREKICRCEYSVLRGIIAADGVSGNDAVCVDILFLYTALRRIQQPIYKPFRSIPYRRTGLAVYDTEDIYICLQLLDVGGHGYAAVGVYAKQICCDSFAVCGELYCGTHYFTIPAEA